MNKKPKIGVIGFSDGEPEVHEELKGIVQEQMDAIVKAKPASAKGQYMKSVTITSTMGPGVKVRGEAPGAENGRGGCGRNYFLLWRVQLS